MLSVRTVLLENGFTSPRSIYADLFGYFTRLPWSSQPTAPRTISVKRQLQLLNGSRCFRLAVIDVRTDDAGRLSLVQERTIDCAIQVARDILAKYNIGVACLSRSAILLSWNTGHDVIDSDDEAEDLVDDFEPPDGLGIELYMVPAYSGSTLGVTPSKSDGVVVEIRVSDPVGTGRTIAHELGHFCGLDHRNSDPTNLMCQSKFALSMPDSANLDSDQIGDILDEIT